MFRALVNWADRSAIFLSSLCVVHCLILPIVLIALPAMTSLAFFSDERFHTWLLFGVIPISLFAVLFGYLHHRSLRVVVIATCGIMILLFVAILGHEFWGEKGEVAATVFGSVLVAYAHIKNLRHRRSIYRGNKTSLKTLS